MSAKASAPDGAEQPAKKGGKKKLILMALPVVLIAAGAGLWFTGILPGLLGMGDEAAQAEAHDSHGAAANAHGGGHGAPSHAPPTAAAARAPVFFDMPEIIANLNTTGKKATYIRLRSKLELAKPEDAAVAQANLPRLLDLFTTYLREMRPEELRGSAGTQRLREELIARATVAAAPARVTDVLFTELLLQ
jgi:flagellar FliL protein